KWQNNVAVLDTERWHWRHPTIDGSNPAPRSYHSSTVVGNLMVVFGGNNQNESFDKVHVLDTSEQSFKKNSTRTNKHRNTTMPVREKATVVVEGDVLSLYNEWQETDWVLGL
ncbi:unnamed protein product, partial [Ectocarpus fasciculatus]